MECLNLVPAVLRILIVFALVLLAIGKKVSLGNAFTGGTVLLGLLFGMSPLAILSTVGKALIDPKTIALAIIVCLILVLSHSMEKARQMQRMLKAFEGLIPHAGLNLITFPALIGLLPMPGGAIFSAPMVKNIGEARGLSGNEMSFVNYWFRHIWEYWWPLYPGVLLTTAITHIDLWIFVAYLFPLTLVAVGAGFWPLQQIMAKHPSSTSDLPVKGRPYVFLQALSPVLIVIVGGLGTGFLLSFLISAEKFTIAKETGLIIALIVAIGRVWQHNNIGIAERKAILSNKALLNMAYMILSILFFQAALKDSQAVAKVSAEFTRWQIPVVLITILLPMLVGIVSGITIAFVATTFPIIITMVETGGLNGVMLPFMMLALVSGFAGVLFSPVHLCLLLSNQYFKATIGTVFRFMVLPCAALLAAGNLYFWVSRMMVGL